MAKKKTADNNKLVAENRRARFDYSIEDTFEAGVSLVGTEVKSLRVGQANIAESYASIEGDELFLINSNIPIMSLQVSLTMTRSGTENFY